MPRRKRKGRPKGAKKKSPRTPKATQSRVQAKRRRLSSSRIDALKQHQERLRPKKGHNYAKRKDCMRLILLLLVTGFIGEARTYVDAPHENLYAETYESVMKQVMCSRVFLEKLWERYENSKDHGDILSPQKRGRKKLDPEKVYEGKQFSTEDVASLEHWVLELNSEEGGVTLKKLAKRFLDEKNLSVKNHVIRKAMMRLGYCWGNAKKLGRIKKYATRVARIRVNRIENIFMDPDPKQIRPILEVFNNI